MCLKLKGKRQMAVSRINAVIKSDIYKVWETVLAVEKYSSWRSDLSKIKVVDEKKFIEYTKKGYPTVFTVTCEEHLKRWEFDLENSNMTGHWTGVFIACGEETEIEFTEQVTVKKVFVRPFAGIYLKKQQEQFVEDLKKEVEL